MATGLNSLALGGDTVVFSPGGSVASLYAGGGRVRAAWESGTMKPTGQWHCGYFIVPLAVPERTREGCPVAALVAGSLVVPAWWWVQRRRRVGRGFDVALTPRSASP